MSDRAKPTRVCHHGAPLRSCLLETGYLFYVPNCSSNSSFRIRGPSIATKKKHSTINMHPVSMHIYFYICVHTGTLVHPLRLCTPTRREHDTLQPMVLTACLWPLICAQAMLMEALTFVIMWWVGGGGVGGVVKLALWILGTPSWVLSLSFWHLPQETKWYFRLKYTAIWEK